MTAAVFFIAGFENRGAVNAATLYDVFSERHLEFYENEIAKEKVFSKYSERELAKMAVDNDISIDKVKKLLVYCHAMKNIGKNYTIKEADKLSNATVISDARKYVDYLKATRSKEELAALEKDLRKSAGDNKPTDHRQKGNEKAAEIPRLSAVSNYFL